MLLTLTIFTPLLFALICLFVRDLRTVKLLTLTGTLLTFFLSLGLILPLGSRGSMTSLARNAKTPARSVPCSQNCAAIPKPGTPPTPKTWRAKWK